MKKSQQRKAGVLLHISSLPEGNMGGKHCRSICHTTMVRLISV